LVCLILYEIIKIKIKIKNQNQNQNQNQIVSGQTVFIRVGGYQTSSGTYFLGVTFKQSKNRNILFK